jgi:hypothetical protein
MNSTTQSESELEIQAHYSEAEKIERRALGLNPFLASTGIQARICRSDLLVEIEALAILVR